jgi:hypothetical protein
MIDKVVEMESRKRVKQKTKKNDEYEQTCMKEGRKKTERGIELGIICQIRE